MPLAKHIDDIEAGDEEGRLAKLALAGRRRRRRLVGLGIAHKMREDDVEDEDTDDEEDEPEKIGRASCRERVLFAV